MAPLRETYGFSRKGARLQRESFSAMVSWGPGQTTVRRVRIKGRQPDPLAARLRLDNILQACELQPAWLPSSAVVCVRSLRDPRPRTLKLRGRNTAQSPAWQQAVSAAVQEKIRRAARPVNSEISAEDPAVIFNDQSELLACLAMDWQQGRLGSHWWWQSLFKGQDVASIVPGAWLNAPQYVPAALALLAVKRQLEPFARLLSTGETRALLREVARVFALGELQSALDAGFEQASSGSTQLWSERSPPDSVADEIPALELRQPSSEANEAMRSRPAAPWRSLVPEALDQTLGLERQCLIGIGLTITRAPAAARSASFARATLTWLRAGGAEEVVGAGNLVAGALPGRATAVPGEDPRLESVPSRPGTAFVSGPPLPEAFPLEPTQVARDIMPSAGAQELPPGARERPLPVSTKQISSPAKPYLRPEQTSAAADASATQPSSLPASSSTEISSPSFAQESSQKSSLRVAPETLPLDEGPDEGPDEAPDKGPDEVRVETEIGGIFYLLNVGLFLELYSDFTAPRGNNLELSIFDFVALIGRRLLNEQVAEDDPVWALLAELARGREHDAPGKGFKPGGEWRLPAPWLKAFPDEDGLEWMTAGDRLRVKHPAGFLLLDVPLLDVPLIEVPLLESDPAQLERELMIYDESVKRQLQRRSFGFSHSESSLEQWLDWIVPYVRARLCRALGLADPSELARLVCVRRASIRLTAVHLDIFFALAEHPVEIRAAGLDRDPGWVPSAGRFVRFHYQ